MTKNAKHQWRCAPIPPSPAVCVLCRIETICIGYDHDLRGHLCIDDFHATRQAEEVLAIAHLEQPTDSILDGGAL